MREDYVYRDYPGTFPADNLEDLMSISKRLAKQPMADGSTFVRFEFKRTKAGDGTEYISDIKIVSSPKKVAE
jgi:hypothetical protein